VPVQVERLALACGHTPRYASVRLRRRTPRSLVVDIDLYNGDGVAVAALSGVRLKAVRLQKRSDERLGFFDEVLTPRPLPGRVAPACIDAAVLRQALESIEVADSRFGNEVEPLLEALCDRYAVDVLAALDTPSPPTPLPQAGEGSEVPSPIYGRGCPAGAGKGASTLHPALYSHLLQRAIAAGYARAARTPVRDN